MDAIQLIVARIRTFVGVYLRYKLIHNNQVYMSVLLYPFNKNVSILSGRKTLIIPSTNNSLRGGNIRIILFVHHSDLSIHLVSTTSLKLMLMKLNTVVVNYLRVCMKENNLSQNTSREIIVYQAGGILW